MKKKKLIGMIAGISATALTLGALVGYSLWHYRLPKFHDVTIELGQPLPPVSEFMTEHAIEKLSAMVTGLADVDVTKTGVQELTFAHGGKTETVQLSVVDTTPPVFTLQDVSADIGAELTAEDFVVAVHDLSEVTLTLAKPLETPDGYGDVAVDVIATDASGNMSEGSCTLSYVWVRNEWTMELGSSLSADHILMNPEKDGGLLDQAALDALSKAAVGTYPISATTADGKTGTCQVTVVDTVKPSLKVKNLKVYEGEPVSKEDLVESATDLSGEVTVTLLQQPDSSKTGTYTIGVEAVDINGNKTTAEAVLTVVKDTDPPTFSGLKEISANKNQKPDYTAGVTAKDNWDGNVEFTYDDSKVDLSKAGTYYVTYTAKDKAGNVANSRRKVVVNHDQEDTNALVKDIAAGLSSDPEAIRDYVRNSIKYSSDWGKPDPVWFGFKNKKGNCYVHALCLQALLEAKGYEPKLIWVTDKRHYWNLIKLNGTWKHIDATPGVRHTKYSLMNDAQRLETLQGREWDTSKWPACE